MKTFLVGGAVRDILLGLEPKDKDFVVVGSSVEEMLSLGFTQVGKDFPVFLHPETGDEYALARKEISTGSSHTDFECDVRDVTLEEDLLRRDLTINSMAMDMHTSEVIDPFGGQQDIKDKILRATSEAFEEDPLRVLRVARFLARLGDEWTIDRATAHTMHRLIPQVRKISAERIWKETEKALSEQAPWRFLRILAEVSAIDIPIFHKIQDELTNAVNKRVSPEFLWAIFCMNLPFGTGEALGEAIKAPTRFKQAVSHLGIAIGAITATKPETMLEFFLHINVVKESSSRLLELFSVLDVIIRDFETSHSLFWRWSNALQAAKSVKAQQFIDQGFTGKDIGDKMREERIKRIEEVLK
jgi:tRNA nucleotidyltransferase (CCA-adding enzyme)